MEGAPAVLCAQCGNDGELVDKALTVARRAWVTPAEDSDVDDELVDQLRGEAAGDVVRDREAKAVQLDLLDLIPT